MATFWLRLSHVRRFSRGALWRSCPDRLNPDDDLSGFASVADRIPFHFELGRQMNGAEAVIHFRKSRVEIIGTGPAPIAVAIIHLCFDKYRGRIKLTALDIALELLHTGNAHNRFHDLPLLSTGRRMPESMAVPCHPGKRSQPFQTSSEPHEADAEDIAPADLHQGVPRGFELFPDGSLELYGEFVRR